MEICEKRRQILVEELDSEDVWNRVEQMLADYLKNNKINMDDSDLTDKLEWLVTAKLKKISFFPKSKDIIFRSFWR
ncbi:MAG: hypothetical protein ABSD42_03160 [Candidatus Bathyarchaeia archaeon]|jgi:hypothetical protein